MSAQNEQTPETRFPYAVFKTGGKQYRVAEGDVILVEKLELAPGETYSSKDVLFVAKAPGSYKVGQPVVSGSEVKFEVLQQTLGEKITIKYHRRRHNSEKVVGHRQPLTRLLVKSIQA